MKIKKITLQNRRDFYADYECEHCGFVEHKRGYDDANFHENVIPKMKCEKCRKTSSADYIPKTTKYPEGMQV